MIVIPVLLLFEDETLHTVKLQVKTGAYLPGESTSSAPIALEDLSLSRPGFTPSQPCQVRDDRVNPDQALKEPPVRKISYSYSG